MMGQNLRLMEPAMGEIWPVPLRRGLRGRFKSTPLEAFRGPC
jgi:hypothetical protein